MLTCVTCNNVMVLGYPVPARLLFALVVNRGTPLHDAAQQCTPSVTAVELSAWMPWHSLWLT